MAWNRHLSATLVAVTMGCGAATACGDDASSCEEGGRTHEDGTHWTCADGCNQCSCNDGTTSSTLMYCGGSGGTGAEGGHAGAGAHGGGGSGAQGGASGGAGEVDGG